MQYLYFKNDGTLHVKAKVLDEELVSLYPNPIAVQDNYNTMTNGGTSEEEGMPTPKREKTRTEVEAEITYAENRAAAYPKIEEQLDKLYHDIANGTLTQSGGFFTAIKTVKDAHPKA